MTDTILTPERILDTAEEVLRRFGPSKTTVVDVARALGVSHGSVYRHFESKAALRDAVTERWLGRISQPLAEITAESGPAPQRLRRWLDLLIDYKQRQSRTDPELFANYLALVNESREVVTAHVNTLLSHLTQILSDGMAHGEFLIDDPAQAARVVLDATTRFHNPVHVREWSDPHIQDDFEAVWSLLLNGLGAS
ncbi:MAG: TetR family transcriptional regulator [Chloroflexi bacterium]|nr:TetR/AcrR family transcriptional regulator [Chloroflexota bacterium]NOG66402.1 TetR family transcriptional regulator [Chloroflexota bacterium]